MNHSMDFFSDTPIARRTDPVSSHKAAERITRTVRSEQKRRVLGAVRLYPGRTSRELAEQCGLDRYMVARRLPELLGTHVRREVRPTGCLWYPL